MKIHIYTTDGGHHTVTGENLIMEFVDGFMYIRDADGVHLVRPIFAVSSRTLLQAWVEGEA